MTWLSKSCNNRHDLHWFPCSDDAKLVSDEHEWEAVKKKKNGPNPTRKLFFSCVIIVYSLFIDDNNTKKKEIKF